MPDDIQERVLRAFQQEHREHLAAIRGLLEAWPNLDANALNEIFRLAHSIKGGARVCDVGTVEKLAHYLESLFAQVMRGERQPQPELAARLEEVLSAIEDFMAALAEQRIPEEPAELLARLENPVVLAPAGDAPAKASLARPGPARESIRQVTPSADTLRVSTRHLERLFRVTPLLFSEASRQESVRGEINGLLGELTELQKRFDAVVHARDASGEVSATDSPMRDLQRQVAGLLRTARRTRSLQSQSANAVRLLSERVERDTRRARMVPASTVFEGFPRMVRELSRNAGREVEFTVTGLENEADRFVLQALKDPVMHALRNAISHGIEPPPERSAAGKPAKGRVSLAIEVVGSQMAIRIEDDGRGVDLRRVAQSAVEKGLLTVEEAAALRPEEARSLLFHPGFSTVSVVTAMAGRGFGLSVVKEIAARLQGSARIEPGEADGTRLRIAVPLTAASHRLLLARASEQVFAIPARAIERVLAIPASDVQMVEGKSTVWIGGLPVLLATLGSLLGFADSSVTAERGVLRVILLSAEGRRLALCVDAFLRELQALLKPLPYPASASSFFIGGAALENGAVALVINASGLIDRFRGESLQARTDVTPASLSRKSRILVVDDSFTARTLQRSILEAAGYDVRVAVDGVEALAEARVGAFDAVITDIQMPRMDGFQLLEAVKSDARLKDTPVILVTSLSSEEDRARGLSLGAEAYIVKQKFDHEDLLHVIGQVL